jgi:hypothetical protein
MFICKLLFLILLSYQAVLADSYNSQQQPLYQSQPSYQKQPQSYNNTQQQPLYQQQPQSYSNSQLPQPLYQQQPQSQQAYNYQQQALKQQAALNQEASALNNTKKRDWKFWEKVQNNKNKLPSLSSKDLKKEERKKAKAEKQRLKQIQKENELLKERETVQSRMQQQIFNNPANLNQLNKPQSFKAKMLNSFKKK